MAKTDLQVPGWPLVTIVLDPDEGAQVDGKVIAVPTGDEPRVAALAHAVAIAARIGRPVRVKLTDPDGAESVLAAHPDGSESVLDAPTAPRKRLQLPKAAGKPKAERAARRTTTPPNDPSATSRPDDLFATESAPPAAAKAEPDDAFGAALEVGDWATAAKELKTLKGQSGQADQVAELEAQLAGVRGDAVGAATQFIALALARHGSHGADHPDTERAAALAQESWGRIADQTEARKVGIALLALRQVVPGPDQHAALQVRAALARLHLS